ncbi:MAG: hypothetical protein QOI89_3589 [Solirubrobacteraceae bacterium]|jgi:hypothetical protein|nr:hypothetical protein [Solirubrobacteraceae bacterium]
MLWAALWADGCRIRRFGRCEPGPVRELVSCGGGRGERRRQTRLAVGEVVFHRRSRLVRVSLMGWQVGIGVIRCGQR